MKFASDMTRFRILGQVIFYFLLVSLIGYLSGSPEITVYDVGETELKLVIRHSGLVAGECRSLSETELKQLPPNMRVPMICPRGKSPMSVDLTIDETLYFEDIINASGIHNDGVITTYQVFQLPVGTRHIEMTAVAETHAGRFIDKFDEFVEFSEDRVVVLQLNDTGFKVSGGILKPHPTDVNFSGDRI